MHLRETLAGLVDLDLERQDGAAPAAFAGEDGSVLATVLDEIIAGRDTDLPLAASDYAELFQAVIADREIAERLEAEFVARGTHVCSAAEQAAESDGVSAR